jgi:Flp pilus assembly protein TadG
VLVLAFFLKRIFQLTASLAQETIGGRMMNKVRIGEKGASVVEFAVVFPLLLLLLFGIIEFSLILFDKAMLTNACREGARAGIVSQTPRRSEAEIVTIAENYCTTHLVSFDSPPVPPNVTVTFPPDLTFGNDLKVDVSYDYQFLLIPALIPGLPQTISLQAESVMKYE